MRYATLCLLTVVVSAADVTLGLDEACDGGYHEVKAIEFIDGHTYTEYFDGDSFVYGERAFLDCDVADTIAYINQSISVMPSAEEIGRYRRIQIHVKEGNSIRHGIRWIDTMIPVPQVMNGIGMVGIAAHHAR
jgi:hypothetical protein